MDKQLKELRDQFNQIPTTFSEKDKQAIRSKISNLQPDKKRGKIYFYPHFLTGVVLAVTILIIVITVNQQPNMFMTSSNEMADKVTEEKATHFSDEHEQSKSESNDMSNSMAESANEAESQGLNIFNPETVQEDMNLPVMDYQQTENGIIITFKGDTLTGRIIDNRPIMFSPNADSWLRIPIAEGDMNKDIPVYVADEEYSSKIMDIEKGTSNTTITPYAIEYHYSPDGSSIHLIMEAYDRISGQITNSYHETIALSEELLQLYEDYKTTSDDKLLMGLSSFDVFKLYHYAYYLGDLEVEYALYSKDKSFPYADKESYIAEITDAHKQTNFSKNQAAEQYEQMLQIKKFDEIKLSEQEVLIRYTTTLNSERHDVGFRLYFDEQLGVYKIAWLPIQ